MPSKNPKPCRLRKRLGKNIAVLRRKGGLTQEELAEDVGVSTWYVQSVERGVNFPSLPVLEKLKKALKSSWGSLFDGVEE